MTFHHIPYSIGLYLCISMHDDIPCANDLAPRDIRRQISGLLAQLTRSFSNDLDVPLDGGLQILVTEETREIDIRRCPLDPGNAVRDVIQILGIPKFLGFQSGTASEYASLRIR